MNGLSTNLNPFYELKKFGVIRVDVKYVKNTPTHVSSVIHLPSVKLDENYI